MFSPPYWGPHAEIAKIRHNITEEEIAETWVYGELEPEPTRGNCWRLIGKKVTLVLNKKGNFIITLYPNKYKDQHKAIRADNAMSIGATRWED